MNLWVGSDKKKKKKKKKTAREANYRFEPLVPDAVNVFLSFFFLQASSHLCLLRARNIFLRSMSKLNKVFLDNTCTFLSCKMTCFSWQNKISSSVKVTILVPFLQDKG